MSPDVFQKVTAGGAAVNLTDRAKFLLTGDDRIRYLNGQVTNDVRKASSKETLYACVTNVKGKVEADVYIHISGEDGGLYLDAEPDQRDPLALRLEKYIIADDVELQDITEAWQIFHLFGKAAEPWIEKAGTEGVILATRFGSRGVDIWLPAGTDPAWHDNVQQISPAEANVWRVIHGVPRWPEELGADVFPQEAGLESQAMDFYKGCYIGQEILSRIKMSGKMPRELVRYSVPVEGVSPPVAASDWKLCITHTDGSLKEVGQTTSIVRHPVLDQFACLAYVRQALDKHSLLLVPDAMAKIRIHIEPNIYQ